MASPQLERGHTRIADELFEAMIRFDFSKRQYKVLLAVIRKTYGYQKKADVISSGQLAELTGLHSPHCRAAVQELVAIGVLRVEKVGQYQRIELIKDYEQWGSKPPRKVEMLGAPGAASSEPVPKQYGSAPPVPKQSCTETVREPVPKQYGKPHQNGTHKKEETEKQQKPPPQQDPELCGGGDDLIYPKALSRKEADNARQQIGSLTPEQRQPVLDVLAAMINAGEIRKSPLAALGGLIRRCRSGTFDPSPGLHVAEQRERAARREVAQKRKEVEITGPPPSTEEITQAKDKLRKFIKPRLTHG